MNGSLDRGIDCNYSSMKELVNFQNYACRERGIVASERLHTQALTRHQPLSPAHDCSSFVAVRNMRGSRMLSQTCRPSLNLTHHSAKKTSEGEPEQDAGRERRTKQEGGVWWVGKAGWNKRDNWVKVPQERSQDKWEQRKLRKRKGKKKKLSLVSPAT